jgi:peptide deformylase
VSSCVGARWTHLPESHTALKLKIVQVGDPVLRQRARDLTADEIRGESIQQLVAHMKETMRDAPGVGLAAPQVGMLLRLAVIEDRAEYLQDVSAEDLRMRDRRPVPFLVIANPRIVRSEGPSREFFEGCLSMAGFMALVPRADAVTVECLDETGKQKVITAKGWYARILQHEIDHLNGAVYVDRMHPRTLTTLDNFNRNWKRKTPQEIQQLLLDGEP